MWYWMAHGRHTLHGPPSVTVKTLTGASVLLPVADGCSAGALKRTALAALSGDSTVREVDVRRAKLYHRGETLNDDTQVGAEMLTLVLMGWKRKANSSAPPPRTAAAPSAAPSAQPPRIGSPTAFAGSPASAKLCQRPTHTSPCLSRSPPSSKALELAGAERQPETTLGAAEGNDCHLLRTGGSNAAEGAPITTSPPHHRTAAVETGTLAQVRQTLTRQARGVSCMSAGVRGALISTTACRWFDAREKHGVKSPTFGSYNACR